MPVLPAAALTQGAVDLAKELGMAVTMKEAALKLSDKIATVTGEYQIDKTGK